MRILEKMALYDDEGKRLSKFYNYILDWIVDQPFDKVVRVSDKINGENLYNIINATTGEELSKEWFLEMRMPFFECIEAVIVKRIDGSYNLLNRDGKLIIRHKNYEVLTHLIDGIAVVKNKKGKINFVNSAGKLVLNTWKEDIRFMRTARYFFIAEKANKNCWWYIYNSEGKKITEQVFIDIEDDSSRTAYLILHQLGEEKVVLFNTETLEFEYEE